MLAAVHLFNGQVFVLTFFAILIPLVGLIGAHEAWMKRRRRRRRR